ncbi:MAG: hypothetical protein GYA02_01065 [Clostridiaceae bacterium]|nr:hypothetical protein [Clostridiaceae bacterium]
MKKLIAILMAGILSVTLFACSGTHKLEDVDDNDKTISKSDTQSNPSDSNSDDSDTEVEQYEQNITAASLAGIQLDDDKEKVVEVFGKDYKIIEHDEAGHFPEPFDIWEYDKGISVTVGKETGKVFEVRSTSSKVETNLGAKVGDSADMVLSLYRSKYEEPESIHGGQLKGVFKVENGAALIFDFNIEDGLVNPEPIDGTDKVERIILTLPTYMDESF